MIIRVLIEPDLMARFRNISICTRGILALYLQTRTLTFVYLFIIGALVDLIKKFNNSADLFLTYSHDN